ncbi:MAG: asparaginase [Acidobacteria bacterium]|nr:asparaginase [Acidobacteriota bacterium]
MKYLLPVLSILAAGLANPLLLHSQSVTGASPLPLVKIVATGGTIANTADGRVSARDVIRDIPAISRYARVEVLDYVRIGSSSMNPKVWIGLANAINKIFETEPEVAGIVVTHGTQTTEETSYFLNLTVKSDKPVALAASQRRHGTLGNDGDRNLLDAIRVVSSPQAKGKGVFVILDEEIKSSRDVLKTGRRPGAFNTRGVGVLGYIDPDQVTFYHAPVRRHTYQSEFDVSQLQSLATVEIMSTAAGASGVILNALQGLDLDGLIFQGFPVSQRLAPDHREPLSALAQGGLPIVITNRGGEGRAAGNPDDLFIEGDNLPPQKARILLMLALTRTKDLKEIQRIFDEY